MLQRAGEEGLGLYWSGLCAGESGPTGRETRTHAQQALYKPITLAEHPGLLPQAFSEGMHRETQGNARRGEVQAYPQPFQPAPRLPTSSQAARQAADTSTGGERIHSDSPGFFLPARLQGKG